MSQPRSIVPDDLFKMKFLQGAAFSPDGKQVVFALAAYDAESDADITQIWLKDLESDLSRQLTFGKDSSSQPAWSPDGRSIAFLSDRGEKPQIYLLPTDGGEAQALTQLPQGVGSGPVWSPSGRKIAFTAGVAREADRDPTDPYRLTRIVYRFDQIGIIDQALQDIFVLDIAGGEPQRLTDDDTINGQPLWSPDGQEILYAAAMLPDAFDVFMPRLRIVNLQGEVRQIVSDEWGGTVGSKAWLLNGKQIAFLGVEAGLPIGTKSDLYVVDISGQGRPVNRSAGYKYGIGGGIQPDMPAAGILSVPPPIEISADGESAYLRGLRAGMIEILRISLDGAESVEPVVVGARSAILLGLDRDERHLLYAVSSIHNPLELFMSDIEGGNERQLTAVNAALLSDIGETVVKPMAFAGQDGAPVEGWMLMPEGGSGPYPTILYIHGGPHSAFGHMYSFDMQMLLGAGYGVLIINHRASMGYGDDFSTAIKGDWGNLDYGDLMAGVDEAIAQGWVDPERMGVCGLSGGGNLSCWIVGQTDRFKAAVPENPVTNWVSFYGTSDIGIWFAVEELGGHPHEIPEVYARCSPITYAHRCTTPTLLVQGEADWRCPAEQSEQFYNVLKANGCPVEMLRLPQSAHGGAIRGAPKIRRAQNEALLDWMNRYVM
ncbi:MAG: S9 family peptidase [Chloroflexota bacterium]